MLRTYCSNRCRYRCKEMVQSTFFLSKRRGGCKIKQESRLKIEVTCEWNADALQCVTNCIMG